MTSNCQNSKKVREKLLKVLVIGDYAVGKSSIIRRYVDDAFSSNYKLTIGVDFSLKKIKWTERMIFHLQLWDIAGHERFAQLSRVYYKSAIAAIVVFDLTRSGTLESIKKWTEDVRTKVTLSNGDPIPILLLANKCDQEDCIEIGDEVINECAKGGYVGWFKTSAKESINIDEAMEFLLKTVDSLKCEPDHSGGGGVCLKSVGDDDSFDEELEYSRVVLPQEESKSHSCCKS